MRTTSVLALLFLCVSVAFGDLYLHMPRGSNDRLNEANTNRNNANRLFDSQNNAKGGYCYGPMMSYYEGSRLPVEWTAQHGCGNPKVECNIVIQYMCGKTSDPDSIRIRDGTTTNTIEDNPTTYNTKDGNGDFVYGMHESYDYYQQCKTRERNMGLFIADREEEGGLSEGRASAIFTRQNNNGNRHGFECTEERDYWPYWHASPWRDIVVLSQKSEYCDFYKKESYNVKSRYHCEVDGTYASYNNEQACNVGGGKWVEDKPLGVPAPDCVVASWSRENHLGNGINGFTNSYNWTLPSTGDEDCIKEDNCECVLRIRYNISSGDLKNNPSGDFTDWKFNADNSPVKENSIVSQDGNEFKLALNTAQYGRTFQDRSYVFGIKPRPKGVAKHARIYNIGVRGKRGNIVQTYPATEYDFTPDILEAHVRDYIHFQWTGCDTNPAGNAGEGTDQTDRSNVVQIADLGKNYPADDDWLKKNKNLFQNEYHRKRFAYLDQTGCPDYDTLLANNGGDAGQADQDPANCYKLNAASAYFDGKLMMVNSTGTYHYMSTRNNNFTNRGQKASVVFTTVLSSWAIGVVIVGSVLFAGSLGVAGAMFYAKSHPQSGIAASLNRF